MKKSERGVPVNELLRERTEKGKRRVESEGERKWDVRSEGGEEELIGGVVETWKDRVLRVRAFEMVLPCLVGEPDAGIAL
jgi:hypothetical protein